MEPKKADLTPRPVKERLNTLLSLWARAGVGFAASESPNSPDLERILLETARLAPQMPRLFVMSATWLHRYGELIATSRLKRLIRDELEAEHHPTLGLLLDISQQGTRPPRFISIIKLMAPDPHAKPLFDIEQASLRLAARACRRATARSKHWGRWCEDFEFKNDALRPPTWLMARNPDFRTRADFRGDLRASILASLVFDAHAGDSEMHMALASGSSTAQVRTVLGNLELTGRVYCTRHLDSPRVSVRLAPKPPSA